MRIALVGARLPRHAWVQSQALLRLADALRARGHDVTLLCDAIEDPADARELTILAHDAYTPRSPRHPVAFARWARARLDALAPDLTLSATRLVPADVLMPVEPSATSWWELTHSRGPVSIAIDLFKHASPAWEALVERRRLRRDAHRVREVWALGPFERARLNASPPVASLDPIDIGAPTLFTIPTDEQRRRLGASLRDRLDIPQDAFVLALGAGTMSPASLAPAIEGLRDADAQRPCIALVGVRDSAAADREGVRLTCRDRLRIVGRTARLDALLSAADAGAIPAPGPSAGACWGATLLAGATVAMGLPLLVGTPDPNNPAIEHARSLANTPEAWARAIAELASERRPRPDPTPPSPDAFVDRAEEGLRRVHTQ